MMRNMNWQGQQRVDVPHLRLVESAVTADLHLLAGQVLAGSQPVVVRGFSIPVTGAIGNPAENLSLLTASGVLLHATAAESGAVFAVPNSQAPEALNGTNPKVIGSFVPGTNYLGIDLVRIKDEATQDSVAFLSDSTGKEFAQTIPLGRSLQYRIYIQTADFDHTPSILPVAKVVVNTDGTVRSITDARQMAFRLGRGGTLADAHQPYLALTSRTENPITAQVGSVLDPFVGCDKSLVSLRDWMGFVMSRVWEVGGGEYWYSPTSDREVKLVRSIDVNALWASTGENFEWSGTALRWKGLRFVFGHSSGWYNTIQDETNGIALAVGECVYVDLDRTQNTTVVATKGLLTTLGQPVVPGSRFIFAWRAPNDPSGAVVIQTRDGTYPVGYALSRATTDSYGITKLYAVAQDQADAIVPVVDSTGRVVARGLTNPGFDVSPLDIGRGTYDGTVHVGKVGQLLNIYGETHAAKVYSTGFHGPIEDSYLVGNNLNANFKSITNLATCVNGGDAANKTYVDSKVATVAAGQNYSGWAGSYLEGYTAFGYNYNGQNHYDTTVSVVTVVPYQKVLLAVAVQWHGHANSGGTFNPWLEVGRVVGGTFFGAGQAYGEDNRTQSYTYFINVIGPATPGTLSTTVRFRSKLNYEEDKDMEAHHDYQMNIWYILRLL